MANEKVTFSTGKVCGNLRTLLNGQSSHQTKTYSLKTLFYHLPFLHRPFVLSYKNTTELFLPFNHAQYVEKDDSSSEAWIEGKVPKRYYHSRFSQYLPKNFEIDKGAPNEEQITVRRKSRFTWEPNEHEDRSLQRLSNYNKKSRENLWPIYANNNRWYLKKDIKANEGFCLPLLVVILGSMHCLSELSRYEPRYLKRHLDCQHNWLLSEFVEISPHQFINGVAEEITGKEFAVPYSANSAP